MNNNIAKPKCFLNKASNYIIPSKSITAIEKDILGIIPEILLMENAANRFLNRLEKHINYSDKIAVIAGPGNNGGDGLAIARLLISSGYNVDIYIPNDISKYNETTLQNLKILQDIVKIEHLGSIFTIDSISHNKFLKNEDNIEEDINILNSQDITYNRLNQYTIIIDALFGIGLNKEVTGHYRDIIININNSPALKFSVDIPSGLFADSCDYPGICVKADYTITFSVSKYALCGYPAKEYAGTIYIENISIPDSIFKKLATDFIITRENLVKSLYLEEVKDQLNHINHVRNDFPEIFVHKFNEEDMYYTLIQDAEKNNQSNLSFKDFRKFIFSHNLFSNEILKNNDPEKESEKAVYLEKIVDTFLCKNNISSVGDIISRRKASHKGTYGKVGLIGGSTSYLGALKIAAISSRRMGSGLVTCIHPESISRDFLLDTPEIMSKAFNTSKGVELATELNEKMDALLIGPGIGTNDNTKNFIKELLKTDTLPIVIDADGINSLTLEDLEELKNYGKYNKSIVLTPHLGEFARLLNISVQELSKNKFLIAKDFSKKYNVTLVLKSTDTIIATEEGYTYSLDFGNNGLSQGGTGDALAGAITSLLGQGFNPTIASILAVYLIGRSSEIIINKNNMEVTSGSYTILEILSHINLAMSEKI